jgi:hypothetical protein
MSDLTIRDLEKVQTQLPDYRMGLVDGEIILTGHQGTNLMRWPVRLGVSLLTGFSLGS